MTGIMKRKNIDVKDFCVQPHRLWNDDWLVLGSGSVKAGNCNAMTVGWGSFGTIWGKPMAQILVRPTRYTCTLLEAYPEFTLCAFEPEFRPALNLFGSASGRDVDKIAQSGLELVPGSCVDAPAFADASLIIECRALYKSSLQPAGFMDPLTERNYPNHDYHHVWFGEILAIQGTDSYRR